LSGTPWFGDVGGPWCGVCPNRFLAVPTRRAAFLLRFLPSGLPFGVNPKLGIPLLPLLRAPSFFAHTAFLSFDGSLLFFVVLMLGSLLHRFQKAQSVLGQISLPRVHTMACWQYGHFSFGSGAL
jgi:hypothetical protein